VGDLYFIGCGAADACADAEVVGGKASGLTRMAQAGLPVPPAFVLPTALCRTYYGNGRQLPAGFRDLLTRGIRQLERATRLTFGGERRPLLVSVRSGAAVSMPGMMDTVLNVGLTEHTLAVLLRLTGNPRHAWDSYRRLVQAYAEVVHGVPGEAFEPLLADALRREAVPTAAELDVAALKELTAGYLDLLEARAGVAFPQDPVVQLAGAVEAVFRSWMSARAVEFRRLHGLNDHAGTAVTVQAMVFGNLGGTSGAGVAFTRDPATGAKRLYVDVAWNAQGEDVVSGRCPVQDPEKLPRTSPGLHSELERVSARLEALFRDAQDFEFTVQEGRLYLLQARDAKRTPWAALRIACDLVREELIDERTALAGLAEYDLNTIRVIRLAPAVGARALGAGVPASPGVAVGPLALSPEAAVALAAQGQAPILVRADISPDDLAGLAASAGVLTARGGRTSHAAVVARQLDKVCVVGCRQLEIDQARRACRLGGQRLTEGDWLSLDGHTGQVYAGRLDVITERPEEYLGEVERWKAHEAAAPGS
jgi:pyruvate,orthophosphate dikinase